MCGVRVNADGFCTHGQNVKMLCADTTSKNRYDSWLQYPVRGNAVITNFLFFACEV